MRILVIAALLSCIPAIDVIGQDRTESNWSEDLEYNIPFGISEGWMGPDPAQINLDGHSNVIVAYTNHDSVFSLISAVKFDPQGNVIWAKTFQDTSAWTRFEHLRTDPQDNIYLLYSSGDYAYTSKQVNILKLTESGDSIWHRALGVEGQIWSSVTGALIESDGSVVVSSYWTIGGYVDTMSTLLKIVKFDAAGMMLWEHETEGIADVALYSESCPIPTKLLLSSDGSLFVGHTIWKDSQTFATRITKLDRHGNTVQSRILADDWTPSNILVDMQHDDRGNFILVREHGGGCSGWGAKQDSWGVSVSALDEQLDTLWTRQTPLSACGGMSSVGMVEGKNIVISGSIAVSGMGMVCYSNEGSQVWLTVDNSFDWGTAMAQISSENIVVAGYKGDSGTPLVLYSAHGTSSILTTIPIPLERIRLTYDEKTQAFYMIGLVRDQNSLFFRVYRISVSVAGIAEDNSLDEIGYTLDQNYPNPFNPTTDIGFRIRERGLVKVSVFDVLGREVAVLVDGELAPGSHTATWNAGGITSGLYFYRLEVRGEKGERWVETKKMVLLR